MAKKARSAQRRRARQRRGPTSPPQAVTPRQPTPTHRPRTPARSRSPRSWLPIAAIGGVLAAVGVIVVLSLVRTSGGEGDGTAVGSARAIASVQSVPSTVLDRIGVPSDLAAPARLPSATPPVTIDGKPAVVYIGAEYCPYCAAERWPMVVALSRFGTFSGLGTTTSSSSDVFPNTPTFTFHGASYTSDYLTFSHAETADRTGRKLESLTPQQQRLFQTYDVQAVTQSNGGIPFIMIGNRYAWAGTSYSPQVLQGKTFAQIAAALSDPGSDIAKSIDGTANQITAMICQLTDGQPKEVCSAPWVPQTQAALSGG